jgi:hypothetical protein
MDDPLAWSEDEMILETVEWWGDPEINREDCRVIRSHWDGEPCLKVVHVPTGKTSDEAGTGGLWTPEGYAWNDPNRPG